MASTTLDPLLELLSSHLRDAPSANNNSNKIDILTSPISSTYLSRLSSLPLSSILDTEHAALHSNVHTLSLSIQSLSSRSHKALIASSRELDYLPEGLERIKQEVHGLKTITQLDRAIKGFSTKFGRDSTTSNERQRASILARNLDRVLDILEIPALVRSCITSGNFAGALDVLGHVRRLTVLYADSDTIRTISEECAGLQKTMIASLITALKAAVKLPNAMRMVGWLKRAMPETAEDEDLLRGLFLMCRLAWIEGLFAALEPLKELADEEGLRRSGGSGQNSRSGTPGPGKKERTGTGIGIAVGTGQHTEKYLKRWIEIFREQSFAVISMYKSIFPSSNHGSENTNAVEEVLSSPASLPSSMRQRNVESVDDELEEDDVENGPPPTPLSTFTLHLLSLLETTLRTYLPNIHDKSARESLLTQVLYAAGSLGRLGGDFSGLIGCLSDPEVTGEVLQGEATVERNGEEVLEEWVEVMRKHKVLASKLEALAAGTGGVSAGGTAGRSLALA